MGYMFVRGFCEIFPCHLGFSWLGLVCVLCRGCVRFVRVVLAVVVVLLFCVCVFCVAFGCRWYCATGVRYLRLGLLFLFCVVFSVLEGVLCRATALRRFPFYFVAFLSYVEDHSAASNRFALCLFCFTSFSVHRMVEPRYHLSLCAVFVAFHLRSFSVC